MRKRRKTSPYGYRPEREEPIRMHAKIGPTSTKITLPYGEHIGARKVRIPSVWRAVKFIMNSGVAVPVITMPENRGEQEDMGLEIYKVVPKPGVTGKQLWEFLAENLKEQNLESYSVLYEAARAAEEAGLVELRLKHTAEFPVVPSQTKE